MKRASASALVPILVACVFGLQPLATDLYLASMPTLRQVFGASVAQIQLTLAVFTLAFGLSQLVYGPLSDRFGRRPLLVFGVSLYAIASLACAFAPSLGWLLVARFFQAVGACSGQVVGRAIIRDRYEGAAAARMFSLIQLGVVAVPIVAPTAGGLLVVSTGWRGIFVAVGTIGALVALAVIARLPETNRHLDASATRPRMLAANSATILGDRRFIGYTAIVAAAIAGLQVYIALAPLLLMERFGLSPQMFGVVFSMPVFGYIATNLMVARFAPRFGIDRLLAVGTALVAVGGALSLAVGLTGTDSLVVFMLPVVLYMIALGLNQPGGMAGAISPFPHIAGTASALLGCLTMLCGAASGYTAARMHDGGLVPFGAGLAISGVAALLAFHLLLRKHSKA